MAMSSQITEEEDDAEAPCVGINTEAQKERIRKIIQRQRCQYMCSASFHTPPIKCTALSFCRRNGSLLELMKLGSASLRRLFDMEHTSLATHFSQYSGSPLTKPILLWGSDSDDGASDPWEWIKRSVAEKDFQRVTRSGFSFSGQCVSNGVRNHGGKGEAGRGFHVTKRTSLKLARTKSFRRLPKLGVWIWRRLRFRLRFRIVICDGKLRRNISNNLF
uniref:Uncharacterized protein n=1 Tax=Kalanchoe fedtschenkoi TaxID=63787 RepID=A0A7N1A9Y5_KALFE